MAARFRSYMYKGGAQLRYAPTRACIVDSAICAYASASPSPVLTQRTRAPAVLSSGMAVPDHGGRNDYGG
eukprot:3756225-Rhodomonas_salina.3